MASKEPKLTFTLTGFVEGAGFRQFTFRCVRDDHSYRSTVAVRVDVNLARRHEIRLQELPLLCVGLLESLEANEMAKPMTLTEERMIGIQNAAREAAEKNAKRPPWRTANPNSATEWSAGVTLVLSPKRENDR